MVSPSIQNSPMRRIPALMTTPCGARITKCVFRIRKKVNALRLHLSTAAQAVGGSCRVGDWFNTRSGRHGPSRGVGKEFLQSPQRNDLVMSVVVCTA